MTKTVGSEFRTMDPISLIFLIINIIRVLKYLFDLYNLSK